MSSLPSSSSSSTTTTTPKTKWHSIPSQKVYVCYTKDSTTRIWHIYYNANKALKWKTQIEDIREEMQLNTATDNHDKVQELREKLQKEFNLSYYDIPMVQEMALE